MSLQFKRNTPRDYSNLKVLFEDTSQTSPKFFRVSDVPQVLTKGKNLLRISAHPSNLVPNSQIIVDIKDVNGDPIYFEVPDYLENDKSRVISIWIYHDKDDFNTANGDATITIYGIARVDQNGKPVPSRYRGKHNVKWSTTINVDRDRENISPVIFKGDTLPTISISESIEAYQNLPSTDRELELTTQTGGGARYIYKGRTPIVQLTDGSEFNQEMVEYSLQLGNFEVPATPETRFENPTNITSYTSSVLRVLDSTTAILQTPFTTTFDDREDLTHTFTSIESADYSISYFQTSSNIVTENQRSYANLTISNVNPIVGYPNKLRVLIKSDGLPGDYELLNEVTVPFSSSLSVKIPIPSEHLEDPKRIKVQYLNSVGDISRTETITEPYNFEGGNYYFGGRKNLISGSMYISNTLDSGIELGGISSGFIRSVGFEGQTSASLGKGPGGFIIYSGSGNLQVGEDVLNGVGLQLIGDNDDRHLIFTTADGGLLDVKTDKFFIGTLDSQFISGSDNNIEISSSLFHLDPQNNLLIIGADAVINSDLTVNNLRTPAIINGSPSTRTNSSSSIDSDGFARFVSASIGGFEVSETQINSSNDNLILKDSGQITGSNVLFSGGKVAGFEISTSQINSTNNNLILKASGQITASDGFLFGNKGTSQYVQFDDGNLVVRGDLSVDQIFTPATIGGSPSNITNASSSITSDGFAKFVSASIGGWDISTGSIEGGNLIMKPEGILQTRDFATGVKGWKISSEGNGTAEFENVRIRGTMRTTTFEKESVNAVGGQLWVANSTTITGSVAIADTTMSVKNAKGFESGEILIAKKVDGTGFQTEYLLVNSSSVDGNQSNEDENYGRIYVTRGYGSGTSGDFVGDLASSAQSYEDGQVVVSTGKVGTGYIKLNANPSDTATPFIDVVERTGSGLYDVTLAARLGDLSGLANSDYVFGNPTPGYGLATNNVFLQGGIKANTGSIGGINMEAGKLYNGVGTWNNSNTGFYVDSASNFSLGDKLTWDGSALVVRGQLQLADGTGVQDAINAVTESSTARALSIGVDSQVYAFDNSADTTATPDTIVFTISQQNLTGTITTSDITITKNGGSTITTPTLGGVVTDGSGQLSGSLSFSGESLSKSDLPLTIEVSKDSLLDTTTIFKVEGGADGAAGSDGADGTDALTAFLTNESHTFPSDVDGNISSFSGGETDMIVFQGVTDVTTDYSFSRASTTSVSSSISDNTVTITSMAHDSGSVIITATSASVTLNKTMSLAKSKQGSDGLDGAAGANAKTLVASVDSQVFAFDDSSDTTATPTEVIFSFNQQNLSGTIGSGDITITTAQSTNVTGFSLDTSGVTDGSGIVSGSISFSGALSSGGLNSTKANLPVTISVSKDSLSDSVKVFRVEGGTDGANGADGTDGVDAVTAFLTNEAHTFAAATDGTIVSFVGGETDMEVFEGVTNKTSNYSFSKVDGTGVTSTISDNTVTVTGLSNDSGSIDITATSGSTSLTKTMSLVKSKQGVAGADGTSAKLLIGSLDSQVFAFDDTADTSADPTSIIFSFQQQNLSGTISSSDITISTAGGSVTNFDFDNNDVSSGTGIVSGSISFSGALNAGGLNSTKSNLPVTITATKDGLTDSVKIFKVEGGAAGADGVSAITALLTNDSHTLPISSSNEVISFAGASTDIIVFQGTSDVTTDYTISRTAPAHMTTTLVGDTVTLTNSTTPFTGSIVITATSASVSLAKTMSISEARQGETGADGADGADNQDFSWANENLTGVGPIASPGLLMTSNVFGFHDGIAGANGSLDDFTSYLDSDGNFYLGSGSSDAQFVWDNQTKELLVSGSNARIEVDKFFVGSLNTQYISGSNGIIEISSSKFHLDNSGNVTVDGTIFAEAGRIASFQITSSKFDALRTVEVFTPVNSLTASFGDGASIPTEVDNRATITITNVTESNISITERVDNTRVYLDTSSYSVNEPYQINYTGSFDFNSGQVTFVSESLDISFPTASFGAITGGFFQLNNESGEFTSFNDIEGNYLESVNGLYAFAIEVPGVDTSFASISNKTGENPFKGSLYSPAGLSLDERIGYWEVNGDDLELFVKPDLRMISTLTGSSTLTVVSSSDSVNYVYSWDTIAILTSSFTLYEEWAEGSFQDGFSGLTNSQNPTEDFVNAYWTASATTYSPNPQYIWIDSGSVDDQREDEGVGLTGFILYTFFLTASNSNVTDQPDANLFAPQITTTVYSGQEIKPSEYNTISSSFFVYSEDIANQFGFRGEDQLFAFFTEGGESLSSSSYAPVRGVSEGRVSWNETRYSSGTPTTGVNYSNSNYHALYLQPGWFINPSVVSILNGIDTNTGNVDSNYPNTWLEIGISGSTYFGNVSYPRTQPGHGVPLTLYNNNVTTVYTPSTEVKLYNSIWPLDIAESGSFQPSDGTSFGDNIIGFLGSTVNITNRLDATRVQTDLTPSQLDSLINAGPYEEVSNDNTNPGSRENHSVTYESTKQYSVGTVSTGFLSGSFVDKVTFRISGSGEVSSSNFFLDEFGNITGSQVNFTGGVISGSDLNISANEFEFKTQNGRVFGDSNNFIISSSLLSLDNNSLEVKGDLRASSGYIQDTYLGGKIVETGVRNPSVAGIRYSLPFLEVWTTSSTDNRLGIDGDDSSQTLVGSHGNWVIGGPIQNIKQYLVTGSALDGVSYPNEFKSWYDISGVSNDYKFIDNFNVLNVSDASSSISPSIIGTQLVFNSASFTPTGSSIVSTVTSEFINISESLNNNYRNTHLQFAARGTTHPYSGGFTGFYPQYRVDIISGSKTFFTKRYKDENATHERWKVFDIPITDILTIDANATTGSRVEREFKVKISMNYSGSSSTGTLGSGVEGIGFALTEMRMVEPVRIASIDTQTVHFKDTYITWDGKEVTAHKGHFAPIITSSTFESISGSEYSLGRPSQRWRTAYLKNSVSTLSDRRLKSNIQISDLGLNFIDSLKPVKYNMGDTKTHYGLIAQEVSQSLAEFNVEKFGGYDADGQYLALRYEEFISPLIKAVQEQSQIIMELQKRVETLESGSNN